MTKENPARRDRLYLEEDADLSIIQNRLIASIGYGSQGHAQAQNLRDAGLQVIVGNREDRYADTARSDGFEVVPIAQAVKRADILLMLVPDELQMSIYHAEIEPHLREGQVLDFASGYAMHFGLFQPPANIDIVLSVPASLGEVLRERYVRGEGVFGHFGVHQNYSGQARQIAMSLAKGMGLLRFGSCECTFGEEVGVNLFAETAGLGAIMKYLLTAYEVLVEAGYSAESAYSETFYELQFFAEYLCKSKLGDTQFGSSTSTYLILRRSGEVVDDHVRQQMRAMLKRIESGELVRDWNLEQTAGSPVLHQLKREIAEHPIRDVEALFLERKEKTGW